MPFVPTTLFTFSP